MKQKALKRESVKRESAKRKLSVARCIKETIRLHWGLSSLLLLSVAGAVVLTLLPPLILEKIVDALAEKKEILFLQGAGFFLVTAASGLVEAARESLITIFGQKVTHRIRSVMSEKLNCLPAAFFIGNEPGATASRFVNDVNTVESLFASGVISMAADICRLAGILIVIFTRSLGLGLMLAAATPFLFWMTRAVQKRMLKAQMDGREAVGRTNQQIPETLKNIRTIRILRQENYMLNRYADTIQQGFRAQERSNFYDAVYSPVIVSVSALLIGIMMAASAQNGAVQEFFGMSAGTAAALIAYVGSYFGPLESVGMEIQNIQSAVAGAGRINEFLGEREQEPAKETGGTETTKKTEMTETTETTETTKTTEMTERVMQDETAVSLRGVCFRYKEGEKEILHDFDLAVKEGESVILAGRTGAGKSTVVKLIAGMYSPQKGSVSLFGAAPDSIPETEKRRWFGYVEQQLHLIPGSVGDQVSLRDPRIGETKIRNALELVGLGDVARRLPEGIYTECRQDLFSQGQLQLLSIARAVALDPKILLLDEITANLDAETEAQVLSALEAASESRTVISVSHRLYDRAISKNARIITL